MWYQWFSAAPMITIDLPWVLSALSANWRATVITSRALHAGDPLLPGRGVGHVVVVAARRHSRRPGRGRCRSSRATGRTPWRPASRRRRAAASSPEHRAAARRDADSRGNARAAGRRNTETPPRTASSFASSSDRRGFASRRPRRSFPRGSICRRSRPSGSRSSRCGTTSVAARLVEHDRLPLRVVGLAQLVGEVRCSAEAVGHIASRLVLHQHAPASACRCSGGSSRRSRRSCRSTWNSLRITWPIAIASAASVPCLGCSHMSPNFAPSA